MTLYVIMGKSLSGKSYLQNTLSRSNFMYAHALKTTTTRPKRTPDEDGYHFVNYNQAESDVFNGLTIAKRNYKVANGLVWTYYLHQNELDKARKGDYTLILDYQGFKELKQQVPELDICGIYLDISLDTRLKRYLSTMRHNENSKEFVRRLYDDEMRAFDGIKNDKSVKVFTSQDQALTFIIKKLLNESEN